VRESGKPADEKHPFGHGKFENVSGAVEAILIFLAAWWIIETAIQKFIKPQPLEDLGWGVVVMFVSTGVNILVSRVLMTVGKETDSIALRADAWHHKTDVWTSIGVMVGLAIVWIGKATLPKLNLSWIDPVTAIAVALLIIKAAWDLTVESVRGIRPFPSADFTGSAREKPARRDSSNSISSSTGT
jgi:cation diffusion facilitator family transporter